MYLAIDLGTTGCRSILFDSALCVRAVSYEEYGLITPREKWTEQDAQLWWDMTVRTAKDAIAQAGIDGKTVRGISISSQGITVVPVDEKLQPLCNALSWLDVRAGEEVAEISEQYPDLAMFAHSGKHLDPAYTLPKLLWIRKYLPEVWQKARKFLMPMDFLIAKFTGNCVTDQSMASGTLMYDIKNCCWSREILETYGIDQQKLPTIAWSGESAGKVLPEVAAQIGLSEQCVVAVGAQDQKCAALGAGLCDGTMTISLGTAGAILKLWKETKTGELTRIPWCGNVTPGTWVTEGVINTAGTCLRWVRDLLFPGESYDVINAEAAAAIEKGSSLMFYPYLNGPSCPDSYPESEGCFYGANLATTRGSFAAAVMEGVAFQIRIILEAMEAYGNVRKLVIFGGGSKSPMWCQIIADITGMEILVPSTSEAAGAGAAMLAAMACGEQLAHLEHTGCYKPSQKQAAYEQKYRKYRSIEKKLWN